MSAPRPHIIFIMTDQQRGDALSIEGHPVLMTPNMDSIAGAGARFLRAYTTCPSCIAARRSLLTGQTPQTHGMVGYQDGVEWQHPETVAEGLRAVGYQTVWIGRTIHQFPLRKRFGFDQMMISNHNSMAEYETMLHREAPEGGGYYGGGIMHNDFTARPWHLRDELHHSQWVITEALRFLENRDPSCPLFLCVSFIAPHPPLTPPSFYFDRYLRQQMPPPVIGDWAVPPPNGGLGLDVASDRVHLKGEMLRSAQAGYYGLINHVDDQIRRLLNPVTGLGNKLGGNHLVMFTSDHGELLGDHHLFRKSRPYEGSARVPLLIRLPGRHHAHPAGSGRRDDSGECRRSQPLALAARRKTRLA
jgi:arylsulfatase